MNMSDMTKKLYPVTGMHCAACAGNVEKIVRKQEGVENASVNLAAATFAVTYNPDIVFLSYRSYSFLYLFIIAYQRTNLAKSSCNLVANR